VETTLGPKGTTLLILPSGGDQKQTETYKERGTWKRRDQVGMEIHTDWSHGGEKGLGFQGVLGGKGNTPKYIDRRANS